MILKNKKAFTLTELLLALAVVGAVAALSIPALLENINRKVLASKIQYLQYKTLQMSSL